MFLLPQSAQVNPKNKKYLLIITNVKPYKYFSSDKQNRWKGIFYLQSAFFYCVPKYVNVCPLGENQAAVHHDTWNKGTLFWQPQNICLISLVVFLLYFTWSSIILWLEQTFFYILPKFGKLGTIPLQRKINIINIKTTIVRLAFPVHKRQYWTKNVCR